MIITKPGSPHLTFVRNASVESVVQPVAFEVDVLGYAVVERVVAEVVAVQLPRKIRVPDVIDLWYPGEHVAGRRVRLGGRRRRGRARLEQINGSIVRALIGPGCSSWRYLFNAVQLRAPLIR